MKKNLLYIALSLIISFIGIVFYYNLNGFPWLKANAKKEIQKYLDETFNSEMVIENVKFNRDSQNYFSLVSILNDEDIKFHVYKGGMIFPENNITNDYYAGYWGYQANDILTTHLIDIINEGDASIKIDELYGYLRFKYSDFGDNLLIYNDVKEEIAKGMKITIAFPYSFPKESTNEDEYDKLFSIIKIIREYTPANTISFRYNEYYYNMNIDKLNNIDVPKDLKQYFQKD